MNSRFNSRFASFSNVTDKVSLRVHSSTYDLERRGEIRSSRLSLRRKKSQSFKHSDEHVTNADLLHHVTQLQSGVETDILTSLDWLRIHAKSEIVERIIQFNFCAHLIHLLEHASPSVETLALECITAYCLILSHLKKGLPCFSTYSRFFSRKSLTLFYLRWYPSSSTQ